MLCLNLYGWIWITRQPWIPKKCNALTRWVTGNLCSSQIHRGEAGPVIGVELLLRSVPRFAAVGRHNVGRNMNIKAALLTGLAVLLGACGSAPSSSYSSSTSAPIPNAVPSISSFHSRYGEILSSANGHTYYMFVPDTAGKSACYQSCVSVWPPVEGSSWVVSGGAKKSFVTTLVRKSGSKQVVYNGHPLYTYTGDSGSNMTNGEGVNSYGGYWYVLNTAGQPVTAPVAGSSGSGPGPSSSNTAKPY